MQFGDLELISLSDGVFHLDGGSMFGVVPKPLWEKRAPADETAAARGLRISGSKSGSAPGTARRSARLKRSAT